MKIFGERLKEIREEQNYSVLQLSRILKISDTTISRWENDINEITAENLYKVAKFFNVSCDYLLGLDNEIL